MSELVYHDVNDGVYRAGFAASQEAYEEAYEALFARLNWLEQRLATQRYLSREISSPKRTCGSLRP